MFRRKSLADDKTEECLDRKMVAGEKEPGEEKVAEY